MSAMKPKLFWIQIWWCQTFLKYKNKIGQIENFVCRVLTLLSLCPVGCVRYKLRKSMEELCRYACNLTHQWPNPKCWIEPHNLPVRNFWNSYFCNALYCLCRIFLPHIVSNVEMSKVAAFACRNNGSNLPYMFYKTMPQKTYQAT